MKYKIKGTDEFLEISQDDSPDDPRNWDNLGTMVCFHNRYTLGDKHEIKPESFEGWGELRNYLIKEKHATVILPLYLYDHSGIWMKVGSWNGLLPQGHAEFDSGQVGFIFCSKEKLKEEKLNAKGAAEVMTAEIATYSEYISGEVYRFNKYSIKKCKECGHKSEEWIDSGSGYYGSDFAENGLYEAAGVKKEQLEKVD